ncbi:hypothetical protein SCOCK_260029 [Actinacidiphila cocklensis]|uniref:Uncharacterized protein n=1 Tax=Actinacidiphila cocklensis TaxID=887465 RepID=A0A9W4GT59_9ACTN|nr:hypothetical protein SCOCK_260029 [Actinacidiphila cocklensis]
MGHQHRGTPRRSVKSPPVCPLPAVCMRDTRAVSRRSHRLLPPPAGAPARPGGRARLRAGRGTWMNVPRPARGSLALFAVRGLSRLVDTAQDVRLRQIVLVSRETDRCAPGPGVQGAFVLEERGGLAALLRRCLFALELIS